jgi:hypothetical protein
MTEQEMSLLRNFRYLPKRDRDDYFKRIEAMAIVYREPTPDERVASTHPEATLAKKVEMRKL